MMTMINVLIQRLLSQLRLKKTSMKIKVDDRLILVIGNLCVYGIPLTSAHVAIMGTIATRVEKYNDEYIFSSRPLT